MSSITQAHDAAELEIRRDLFFEQDTEVLAASYRHGLLRSVAVLCRALLARARPEDSLRDAVQSGRTVAVTFFPNEHAAVQQADWRVGIERALQVNPRNFGFVREQLGVVGVLREASHIIRWALTTKGARYVGRLTYPILAWLFYRALSDALREKTDVTIVTTNMQHPLSIAAAWAAIQTGQTNYFLEHATTPRLVFRDRGYRRFFVQFPHTALMMTSLGIQSERICVLTASSLLPATRVRLPLRAVGVCINVLDSLNAIGEISTVLKNSSIQFTYRVHDADPRIDDLRKLSLRSGAAFSNARESRIESFLEEVDLVVAGNSNVVADAIKAGKPVIYYWGGARDLFDYYGLVAYYKLPSASSCEQLRAIIQRALSGDTLC